ncbi:MAG TPA: IclR family transcriptional regulator [Gammaproteobacteria bacterium]|jgi:DNA-binding IclR family transcriptional regulator|nr:IclR family transcriptional regulator [Acidiferrobacteraceae bacterium]MDP6413277.1 IclR family transcriptional regulator [Arenicellales bacterium]MDP6551124.1 IclR family transcriptional regulator [Arenicellales bacterium]HCX88741.1 IclR family transcriptional regulator [Gammaproteobacteria bacterium]|tara:strand:- start:7773 stop:8633 length:861 start_codon:yes stop_codon:yes gene_type:complete
MIDKTKKFSVVETSSGRESESGLTADAERYEQLAGLGVTGKAFSVLEVVSQNPQATKMAEIIHGTGMTKPTAHRVVNMLLDMGFLERDDLDNGFIEGTGLVDLAHRTLAAAAPRSLRHSILEGISSQVGETVNYGVLSGSEVIYLDRVEAKWPLGLRFNAGSRVPAHCTAIGKLLLSRMPDSDLRALIESMPRPAYTTNTITDVEPLLSVLENIRRDGIGADDQEFMHGVICVSVPVVDEDGRCFGGIAISAPEARMTLRQMLTHVPQMRKAAENLAAAYRRSSSR